MLPPGLIKCGTWSHCYHLQKEVLGGTCWWPCGEDAMTFVSPCHASPHPSSVEGLHQWNYWQRQQCLQMVRIQTSLHLAVSLLL